MMCEPVISRDAQSLKLWLLAWLSMIDIYLHKPVICQCHISVGCKTTNSASEQKYFMASPIFPKQSDWTNLSQTAFVDPSVAPLLLSQGSIIPTNVSLINELLLKVQQLWIQMDAKVLLMIMKHIVFFHPFPLKSSVLLPICFKIYGICG